MSLEDGLLEDGVESWKKLTPRQRQIRRSCSRLSEEKRRKAIRTAENLDAYYGTG